MNERDGAHGPAAVVFDCDGLLVDSEALWTRAETELFRRHGREFTLDDKKALLGTGWLAGGRVLERLLDRPGAAAELAQTLLELVTEEVVGRGVHALPGALELVEELRGRVPLGIASNSPRGFVDAVLASGGFVDSFDAYVTGDELESSKPAPDAYIEVCARLAVEPSKAIALEDSPPGVASARAAGLFVIGIPSLPGLELEADLVAPSLAEPEVRAALGLA
jgi:HAD superfamily hydrolase (TIGR01509 family)